MSLDLTFATTRQDVADTCVALARAGLVVGTAGNVSARVGDLVAVTATGVVLADATADDVTVVDLDGRVRAGRLRPTSELALHLGIYRRRDVTAVVHTHAPASTAVGLVLPALPVIHYQLLPLGGEIPVVPFHPFGTPELAEAVVDALAGKRAALMANHGAVTIGDGLREATEATLVLEWACGLYRDASVIGPPRALTDEQQRAVLEVVARIDYGATHDLAEPADPHPSE